MPKKDLSVSKLILGLFTLFLLLIIQEGVLNRLNISPVNLILIFLIIVGILNSLRFALALGLVGGLMLDFTSPFPDGLIIVCCLIVILLLDFVINKILAREPSYLIYFGSVLGGTIVFFVSLVIVNKIFIIFKINSLLNYDYILFHASWIGLILNLIFTYPVLRLYLFMENLNQKLFVNRLKLD